MGLDNLIDEEEQNNQQTSSSTSTKRSLTDFAEPDIRENVGLYGYESKEDVRKTIEGKLTPHDDQFKYHMPIFPHIERNKEYNFGSRYKLNIPNGMILISGTVSCIYMRNVTLSSIPRELIMLDTGNTEKEKCYSVLQDRFNEEVSDDTTVCLHIFIRTKHTTKIALGDEQSNKLSTYPIERILKAVYGESWTSQFRATETGISDTKHPDQIGIWNSSDEFSLDE